VLYIFSPGAIISFINTLSSSVFVTLSFPARTKKPSSSYLFGVITSNKAKYSPPASARKTCESFL